MKVILSIKPEFCDAISSGRKKFEFRKRIFRDWPNIETIYIYSTSPVQRIIGSFSVETIIEGTPEKLWEKCEEGAGINRQQFFNYFKSSNPGYAIQICNLELFTPINPWDLHPNFTPPQSFCYVPDGMEQKLNHS